MAAMVTEHDVVRAQGVADTDRDRFLSNAKMSRRTHLLLAIALRQQFLRDADLQKIAMQRDKKFALRARSGLIGPHRRCRIHGRRSPGAVCAAAGEGTSNGRICAA